MAWICVEDREMDLISDFSLMALVILLADDVFTSEDARVLWQLEQ